MQHENDLEYVLNKAAMPDNTVIITTLNAAWAENNTMIDIFLESLQHGQETQTLLKHVVIACVDEKAYARCLIIHPHCIRVKTKGVDFSGEQALLSQDYIKMIWRRIQFLTRVLELNYNFIFTDADILWFRDPFPILRHDSRADMQIACDHFNGRPWDVKNSPNAGFAFVRANKKTLKFYRYWYEERRISAKMADQEVFNVIKHEDTFRNIGMNLRFLDTHHIGGFCSIKYTDMTKAYTLHANCCKGLNAKLHDLREILDLWKRWQKHHTDEEGIDPHFTETRSCQKSMHRN
ncbi:hypothetical protein KP509_17G039200 [Ceratopteris richardii]|uniref:Glycosyltransferase n=1 Tax=Ceratopteris richardii TaxID=49495 RepID=A0A8T2SVL4_CERRI|nr:hypothetical protein KP509_17G039200 [Ceratopteris richardii]